MIQVIANILRRSRIAGGVGAFGGAVYSQHTGEGFWPITGTLVGICAFCFVFLAHLLFSVLFLVLKRFKII
ncbi:MAG: hypothetical protein AAFY99_04010 [Pseudomonadota bacterium]